MKETIAVYGARPTLCSAPDLLKGLRLYSGFNVVSLFYSECGDPKRGDITKRCLLTKEEGSVYWLSSKRNEKQRIAELFCEADHLIVLGTSGFKRLGIINKFSRKKRWKTKSVIVGNGNLLRNPNYWVKKFSKYDAFYLMPDLYKYSNISFIPYYPPFDSSRVEHVDLNFDGKLNVSHSPGPKEGQIRKGTKKIEQVIASLSKKYDLTWNPIYNMSYIDCLKVKRNAHIFIDQIVKGNPVFNDKKMSKTYRNKIHYNGGLAKSGLEAMGLGCVTITTADLANSEPYYTKPPVILTDYDKFENDLITLLENRDKMKELSKIQKEWATKYVGLEYSGKHFVRHIMEKK
ncbi:MAG: hypothetical protein WC755_02170 [Candidatus Woesearchaeota archaeon]